MTSEQAAETLRGALTWLPHGEVYSRLRDAIDAVLAENKRLKVKLGMTSTAREIMAEHVARNAEFAQRKAEAALREMQERQSEAIR